MGTAIFKLVILEGIYIDEKRIFVKFWQLKQMYAYPKI